MDSPSNMYHTTPGRDHVDEPRSSEAHNIKVELDQEQVDSIIRSKRKVRDPKACYACHRRKVKCDRKLPCDSCIKRDHPELCSYERPTKKRKLALSAPGDDGVSEEHDNYPNTVTISKEQWDSMTHELAHLRESVARGQPRPVEHAAEPIEDQGISTGVTSRDEVEREGVYATSNQMGTAHLGSRSVLAYMMGLGRSKSSQDAARSLLEENILPKLGLDNESTTYPFVDLWSKESSMQDVSGLCSAIPEDNLCREFFYSYRQVAGVLYPILADIDVFERDISRLLETRRVSQNGEMNPNRPYGVSFGWLALYFALLASGAQCTTQPAKERELTSQVFVCCSYQALRMSNFLTHPSLETIQATCVIANVLSYNMNPGVAYIFLGMTLRMAYSMGLQADSQNFSENDRYRRARTWWMLAWQDSHFSVSYDRPSSSVLCHPPFPYTPHPETSRTYAETMFGIIALTQEIVRERMIHPKTTMTWTKILHYKEEVQRIVAAGSPHLRDRSLCYGMVQHLEHLALKLHSMYITSELCRPALKESPEIKTPSTPITSPNAPHRRFSHGSPPSGVPDLNLPSQLRADCISALQNSIEAYIEIVGMHSFASRSWIGIQRAVSAAFLLGTLRETPHDLRSLSLLREFELAISQPTTGDPGFSDLSHDPQGSPEQRRASLPGPPIADSPHWARSMTKSLSALGKLNSALANSRPRASANILPPPIYSNMYKPSTLGGGMNPLNQQQQQSQYPPITNPGLDPYSPAVANAGGNGAMASGLMGPYTPDSTGSSDWNFTNIMERASEYVQPALWA